MKLFETAEVAKLDPEEFTVYQASLNAYRDMKNSIDTALEEGEIKGEIKGRIKVAKNSLKAGLDIEIIAKITGLSKEDIESLRKESND